MRASQAAAGRSDGVWFQPLYGRGGSEEDEDELI